MQDFTVAIIGENTKTSVDGQLVVISGADKESINSRDDDFLEKWCEFATRNKVFIVPGLYIEDNYLCLCLIDDRGKVVGVQKACHINKENFPELIRDSNLNIIETPFARVFLCADVDIYKPELVRAAVFSGAEIIISVQYIQGNRCNESMVLAGAWQNAQQNCVYIINAHNFGGNIIGPCETSEDLSGFIKRMGSEANSISANLSSKARDKAYDSFPIFKTLNTDLYQKAFKQEGDHL